jgi:hypothetical protein
MKKPEVENLVLWTHTVCETLLVQEVESGEYLPAQAADVIQLKPLPSPCTQPN